MKTVRNKKELEAAIIARETEVIAKGIMFKIACKGAAKYQKYILEKRRRYKLSGTIIHGAVNVPATPIYIAIIAAVTGLAIIAMCKKYDVEIDISKGILKLTYNEGNNKQYSSSITDWML